jgi:hypothetical protein
MKYLIVFLSSFVLFYLPPTPSRQRMPTRWRRPSIGSRRRRRTKPHRRSATTAPPIWSSTRSSRWSATCWLPETSGTSRSWRVLPSACRWRWPRARPTTSSTTSPVTISSIPPTTRSPCPVASSSFIRSRRETHTLGRADIIQEPRIHGSTVEDSECGRVTLFRRLRRRAKDPWRQALVIRCNEGQTT